MKRIVQLAALAAALSVASPVLADPVSPKQAIRIMQKAGYSGIGGVTLSRGNYVAAAIGRNGKRVRVSVDADSGSIVRVAAFPRGAGSITPQATRQGSYEPPRIGTRAPDQPDYYQAPRAPSAIGVRNYPWRADQTGPAQAWCRYRANAPGC